MGPTTQPGDVGVAEAADDAARVSLAVALAVADVADGGGPDKVLY